MFTRYAPIQRVFAAAEVATVGKVDPILSAVSVPDECTDLAVSPMGNSDGESPVSQTTDG
jgi:hypothetical protein